MTPLLTDPSTRPAGAATRWWGAALPVYDAILAHPFLAGLADGTLPAAAFERYLVQDAHYLRGYARALALVAAHGDEEGDVALFARSAATAIAVERQLHAGLLAELGIDPEAAAASEPGPATTAYVDSLVAAAATGSFADGLAAVLPCYWVYARVGEVLLPGSSPDPRYAAWIATYADPGFQQTVAAVLDVVDRVGADLTAEPDARARRLYRKGTVHEWLFWDAAWTGRSWPSF
ncbi:thiaminase /4-amino-5-aminomethyl-2-methylpyrimidine deaminase [Motilibacter rhizosphaerae]|uniref:Thiaminase /4-amino-5-aminomethyl-2-methylpyrimidine deaminase n=1 Tax=Motilibacter rhizosphaerae TaxID=598652 RepID=A0A4Q7NYJ7_9ACTN|nr:TenA family protein [Motilibacter rhizosphaerae]RZS91472.1 thiaminase /4-amino-5-aminomethyl-2-methylpyrimidine deaminase [Motilibacter rhizosphaerae]